MSDDGKSLTHREWVVRRLEQYEARLFQYAVRIARGDRDIAMDAVQHTFLRLCDQDREVIEPRMPGWLYRVCRNKVVDERRARSRESGDALPSYPQAGSLENDPSKNVEQTDSHQQLLVHVDRLPAAQREAIMLWAQGLSYREIAKINGKSYVAVRVTVHRAIERLKQSVGYRQQHQVQSSAGEQQNSIDQDGSTSHQAITSSTAEIP